MLFSIKILLCVSLLASFAYGGTVFYEDFENNDISDWYAIYGAASWSASGGMVHGSTGNPVAALVPEQSYELENVAITTRVSGVHAFGIVSRLTDSETGIYAYVSPDHNVARIRRVTTSGPGPVYATLSYNFPSGVFYQLTLTCDGPDVVFNIEVPSTGDSWTLGAIDPYPAAGSFGLIMGDENGASWDWISVSSSGGGASGPVYINWFETDDQALGNGNYCLEPGETIDLPIELANDSTDPLENAFGILQALNTELLVTGNYVDYGTVPAEGTAWGSGSFGVQAPSGTPADQAYSMRLTVMADGGFLHQTDFLLPVGVGHENTFEDGPGLWGNGSVEPGWANDWHRSSSRNSTPGGSYAMKCGSPGSGDYSNNHYGYLETPYFNIPPAGEISFWTWIDAQEHTSAQAYDGGIVQYRRTGQWLTLEPSPEYTHQIVAGTTGPFPESTPVYSGAFGWRQHTIAVPDSLAGPGAIRFVFGSDGSGNREGWYIDDFLVADPQTGNASFHTAVSGQNYLTAMRNPFFDSVPLAFMFSGPGETVLEVFDLSGRLVRSYSLDPSAQPQTLIWDGSDSSGKTVAAGVYFARIRGLDTEALRLVKL